MTLFFALTLFVTSSGVQLAWDQSPEPDIAGYHVYRAESGSELQRISELVESTTYTDETVEAGLTYQYAVTAVNEAGLESEFSEIVETTVQGIDLEKIQADIADLQDSTRSLRDQADVIRSDIQVIEDQLDNDPEFITRRYVAGNAVRQYEIILSHLNALVRLLGEVE